MWWTVEELAKHLRVGRTTAYELCRRPDFPVVRITPHCWRVRAEAVEAWLAEHAGEVLVQNTKARRRQAAGFGGANDHSMRY
ncbi:MAG: helix-turn-helix domain-containing protein [Firmicutes bacterium]|nr:helix-turn-helix domain-containing protein [Bacillota bacterium]